MYLTSGWIPITRLYRASVWANCGAVPLPIDGVPVYGGLDLSSVADLTALVLIGEVDGAWQVHPTFWLPGVGAEHEGAGRPGAI